MTNLRLPLALLALVLLVGCAKVPTRTVYVETQRLRFSDCYPPDQMSPDEECLQKWQKQFDECYIDLDDGGATKCCIDNYCFIPD